MGRQGQPFTGLSTDIKAFQYASNSRDFLGAQHRNKTEKTAITDAELALVGVWGVRGKVFDISDLLKSRSPLP